MTLRRAMVEIVSPVSIGDNSSPAWEIDTNLLTDPSNRAFYIPRDVEPPHVGQPIEWGDYHVWYGGQRVHKLGLSFDPFAPLH